MGPKYESSLIPGVVYLIAHSQEIESKIARSMLSLDFAMTNDHSISYSLLPKNKESKVFLCETISS